METTPSYRLLGISALLGCLYIAAIVVRRIFFHPLSKYSGPILGKFTDLPIMVSIFKRRRAFKQYELLRQYGSPVRIGTNTLLFSDMKAFPDTLGQSSKPCLKDPAIYAGLSATGEVNVLNAIDRNQHSRLRRLISHSFSLKSLLEHEDFMGDKIDEYLSGFQAKPGQRVDILERTHELFLDIVSQLSFGESFDCLSGKSPHAHRDVKAFFTVVPAFSMVPALKYLPIRAFRDGLAGLGRLQEFSRAHVLAYVDREKGNAHRTGQPEGKFLQNLAQAVDSETGTKLTQAELIENAIIFLTAGSGTTAATTIYLIWECGKHPAVRKRLIEEIRTKFPDPSVRPTYEEAASLPFLDCVVQETLRLRGPLNSGAARISPGKVIVNEYIPEGIQIEVSSYASVRDPDIFPNPLGFNPSRWENATEDMRNMAWPFSYGPRNCVGRHLAEIGLFLTVARLYQLYDIVPDPDLRPEDMRPIDFGVQEPACEHFHVMSESRGKT